MSGGDEQHAGADVRVNPGIGPGAAAPDWVKLRHDYENRLRPASEIATEAGITRQKLAVIARREGWALRGAVRTRSEATRATVKRLKALLQQRLSDIEGQIAALGAEADTAASERDIRAMNTLVRTLEKVLELERKDCAERAKRRRRAREFDDTEREALARKLEGLRREQELASPGNDPQPEPAGGVGGEP